MTRLAHDNLRMHGNLHGMSWPGDGTELYPFCRSNWCQGAGVTSRGFPVVAELNDHVTRTFGANGNTNGFILEIGGCWWRIEVAADIPTIGKIRRSVPALV